MALRRAPRALAFLCEDLGAVDHLDRALLELDSVAAGRLRLLDQPLGDADVAVMIDSNLGDDVDVVGDRPRLALHVVDAESLAHCFSRRACGRACPHTVPADPRFYGARARPGRPI